MRFPVLQLGVLLSTMVATMLCTDSVFANHRRRTQPYGAAPSQRHLCHPHFMNAGPVVQPLQLQSAPIPPALVPILMGVGPQVGSVAIDQLLALLERIRQENGLLPGTQDDESIEDVSDSSSEIEDISKRLRKLEEALKIESVPDVEVENQTQSSVRRGKIDLPTSRPTSFPAFR